MLARMMRCVLAVGLLAVAQGCVAGPDDASYLSEGVFEADSCTVRMIGGIASGDTAIGAVTGSAGVVSGVWVHHTAGGASYVGEPNWLVCRINGAYNADFSGPATLNGVGGYTFRATVRDRGYASPRRERGTPVIHELVASRTYSPSRWSDATLALPDGGEVAIPEALPVSVGNAGNQWAWLTFTERGSGDAIRCRYRGGASCPNPTEPADIAAGRRYELFACERLNLATGAFERDATLRAGTRLDVTSIVLHVHRGSSRHPSRAAARTTVTLALEVTPWVVIPPADRDYYRVIFFDSTGTVVYWTDGQLTSGDLVVEY